MGSEDLRDSARLALLVAAIAAGAPAVGAPPAGTVFPGSQWTFRTPAETGMNGAILQQVGAAVGGRGCVVRNGTMVHTWGSQSQRADIASAAKPIYLHLLLGAVEGGLIPSLDDAVVDFEPALFDLNPGLGFKDRDITWRHMANQISCYGVVEAPGTTFDYSDWQTALPWDTLFIQVYGSTYATVDDDVFRPMLTDVLQCEDDPTMMIFGTLDRPGRIGISVRDLCRFGLLYLHGGNWGGAQLISQAHASMAVTSPLPISIPRTGGVAAEMIPGQRSIGGMNNQFDHLGSYSYLWWVNGVDGAGQLLLPDVPTDAYVAWGNDGRRLLAVIPSLGIVMSWNEGPIGWSAVNLAVGAVADAVLIDDTTPPDAPTGLAAIAVGDTTIDVSWQPAADPRAG